MHSPFNNNKTSFVIIEETLHHSYFFFILRSIYTIMSVDSSAELLGLFFTGAKNNTHNTNAKKIVNSLMNPSLLDELVKGTNYNGDTLKSDEANPDFVSMIVKLGHGLRILDKSSSNDTVISDLVAFAKNIPQNHLANYETFISFLKSDNIDVPIKNDLFYADERLSSSVGKNVQHDSVSSKVLLKAVAKAVGTDSNDVIKQLGNAFQYWKKSNLDNFSTHVRYYMTEWLNTVGFKPKYTTADTDVGRAVITRIYGKWNKLSNDVKAFMDRFFVVLVKNGTNVLDWKTVVSKNVFELNPANVRFNLKKHDGDTTITEFEAVLRELKYKAKNGQTLSEVFAGAYYYGKHIDLTIPDNGKMRVHIGGMVRSMIHKIAVAPLCGVHPNVSFSGRGL